MSIAEEMALFIASALGAGMVFGMIIDGWSALWQFCWNMIRDV